MEIKEFQYDDLYKISVDKDADIIREKAISLLRKLISNNTDINKEVDENDKLTAFYINVKNTSLELKILKTDEVLLRNLVYESTLNCGKINNLFALCEEIFDIQYEKVLNDYNLRELNKALSE